VQLRRWWVKKYNLPWTHEAAQCLSHFEILTEFYEDYFEGDKTALYKEVADESGHVVLPDTGDELIDKWERELAQGLTPDLEEGMTPEARKMAEEEKKEAVEKKLYGKALGGGFSEDYKSQKAKTLGQEDEPKKEHSKLIQYAKSGGLDKLDKATLSRMISSLSPVEAEQIISMLKRR
jgi:uncharacterized protein YmfQ (DUF2313 family)